MKKRIEGIKSYVQAGLLLSTLLLATNVLHAYEKPKIEGFVLRGDVPSGAPGSRSHFDNPFDAGANWGDKVDGIVITAEWADLQKTAYGEIESNNVIDQAIKTIAKWNATVVRDEWIYLKLRVFAGIYSPSWVADSLGSMEVDYKNAKQGTLPYFWKSDFQYYWGDFQKKLAERYDNNPLLLDVALSGCMTHNAETMWRNYGSNNKTSIEDLKAHGLTVAKDERCLLREIDIAAAAWKSTNISMAVNGWKNYDEAPDNGNYPKKIQFTKDMIDHCKAMLGNRCIVGNNSVGNKTAEKEEHLDSNKILQYVRGYANDIYVQTTTKADHIHIAINYSSEYLFASMAEIPRLKDLENVFKYYLGSAAMQNARIALKENDSGTTNQYNANISSMFRVNDSRAYSLREDGRYSRYDIAADKHEYVSDISGNWPSTIEEKYTKISASFLAPNGTVYMFMNNGKYLRYYNDGEFTHGPYDTSSQWSGITDADSKKIVGALPWKNSQYIFLFLNDGRYIKYDWDADSVVYTKEITEENWPGLSAYKKEITAAIKFSENAGYIFLTNDRYIKYDYNADSAGTPNSISYGWGDMLAN